MPQYIPQSEYIDENLNIVMQNPDSVMYLRPYDIGNKRALFAVIREDQGVYKKVQITKEQSKMRFPFEPIYYFYNGPGYFLLKDFIAFDNSLALNPTHLDGFRFKEIENDKIFKIGVFATFSDGSATPIIRNTKREFNKKGGLQFYIDELKKYKDCEQQYETYQIIECFSTDDDTFVIPELQQAQKGPVRKLTENNK